MRATSASRHPHLLVTLGIGILACGAVSVYAEPAFTDVTVKVDRAILRLEPSFQGEVVTQVDAGAILHATGQQGEWTSVVPPTNVCFWVHSDFVTNGLISGSLVRVRLGPSVNHFVVAELNRDAPVSIRGRDGDWYSIAPPPGILLWINTALVTGQSPEGGNKAGPRRDPWRDRRSRGI